MCDFKLDIERGSLNFVQCNFGIEIVKKKIILVISRGATNCVNFQKSLKLASLPKKLMRSTCSQSTNCAPLNSIAMI